MAGSLVPRPTRKVIEWCWARREKILFFPDEHLGRNTANKMGVPREQMIVWDPYMPRGGNTARGDSTRQADSLEGAL
jgi:hypothetical protein